MHRKNVLNALQFQNYGILNNQIETITTVQLDSLVLDRKRHLPLKNKTPEVKFATQTLFIGRFEQARTKRTMDFDGGSDDLLRKLFMKKYPPCLSVSVVK